jgi:hypothetical protein
MEITTYSEFGNMPDPEWPGTIPEWKSLRPGSRLDEYSDKPESYYTKKLDFNMTISEIADEIGISEGSVKRLISQALSKLEVGFEELTGLSGGAEIIESMVQYEYRENFFNPNQGGNQWAILRYLLQA